MDNYFAATDARKHREVVKRHGRIDTLTYYQMSAPDTLSTAAKWKGLKTIGVAIRVCQQGGEETSDVRYYISSNTLSVRSFAKRIRGHWAIEDTLH